MGVGRPMAIQMAGNSGMAVAVAISPRGLRQPRRVTDRAGVSGDCANGVAEWLQPLQNGLPLFPIELSQKRPQSLDEGILEQCFAVGFRNKETVQTYVQRLGDFLQRSEAGRHLPTLNARKIRAGHLGARLQLTL